MNGRRSTGSVSPPRRIRKRPGCGPTTKQLIDNFELVVSSRWPTVQDIRLPSWGRMALKALSSWRYRLGVYSAPSS